MPVLITVEADRRGSKPVSEELRPLWHESKVASFCFVYPGLLGSRESFHHRRAGWGPAERRHSHRANRWGPVNRHQQLCCRTYVWYQAAVWILRCCRRSIYALIDHAELRFL